MDKTILDHRGLRVHAHDLVRRLIAEKLVSLEELAKGDLIDADGGCVIIKHSPSGRALVLDARTPAGSKVPIPRRTPRALVNGLTCDTP
jgi:hypothetical protein